MNLRRIIFSATAVTAFWTVGVFLPVLSSGASLDAWYTGSFRSGNSASIRALHSLGGEITVYTIDRIDNASAESPTVCIGEGGRAAAAWLRKSPYGDSLMQSVFDGHTWSSPEVVRTTSDTMTSPSVSFAGPDSLWIAWTFSRGDDTNIAAALVSEGTIKAEWTFGSGLYPDILPAITATGGGRAHLVWQGYNDGRYRVQRTIFDGQSWSAPEEPAGSRIDGSPLSLLVDIKKGSVKILSAGGRGPGVKEQHRLTEELSALRAAEDLAVGETAAGGAWTDGRRAWSGPLPPADGPAGRLQSTAATAIETTEDTGYDLSHILCVGDSTTYGRGSSTGGPVTGYTNRLESFLKGPWLVKNRGISGDTSLGVLSRIERDLNRNHPGLTILMIGLNDAYYGIDNATIIFNIRETVKEILSRGGMVLLATTTPVIPSLRPIQYERLITLNRRIKNMAAREGYPLLDLWNIFHSLANWEYRFMDWESGNHPNNRGYKLMARQFRSVIESENLLYREIDWAAFDPLVPGQFTIEDSEGTTMHIEDTYSPLAMNDIKAVCGLDLDGDGRDSVGAVLGSEDGQALIFYSLPAAGTFGEAELLEAVQPLAEADWMTGEEGPVTHIFGIDVDGDGIDEIGLVRYKSMRRQALEIWRANQPGLEAPQRLVYDKWIVPRRGRIRDISSIQADEDPQEELLVLAEKNLTGEQSILIFDTPPEGADTFETNTTTLLYQDLSVGSRIGQVIGQDISSPEDGIDEIIILRLPNNGRPDRLQAYALPPRPWEEPPPGLTNLSLDRWARINGAHNFIIEDLVLDDGAGGTIGTLAVWHNY